MQFFKLNTKFPKQTHYRNLPYTILPSKNIIALAKSSPWLFRTAHKYSPISFSLTAKMFKRDFVALDSISIPFPFFSLCDPRNHEAVGGGWPSNSQDSSAGCPNTAWTDLGGLVNFGTVPRELKLEDEFMYGVSWIRLLYMVIPESGWSYIWYSLNQDEAVNDIPWIKVNLFMMYLIRMKRYMMFPESGWCYIWCPWIRVKLYMVILNQGEAI